MQFTLPSDPRLQALLAVCTVSVLTNVVLSVVLVWPSGSEVHPAPVAEEVAVQVAEGQEAGGPIAEAPPAVEAMPADLHAVRGSVDRNLAYTLAQAGVTEKADALAQTTARLFVWDLDLRRDMQRGDDLQVLWSSAAEHPEIYAARYVSKKQGRTLSAYRFKATGDNFYSYWSEDGTEVPHSLVGGPLPGGYEQITSLLKDRPSHAGMDFKLPVGQPVVTPRAGTVTKVDWNFKYNGNCAEVRWADGTIARFLHLSQTTAKAGQQLAAGAQVGLSGNTGRSTAPHLHYELERSGRTVDPVEVHGTVRRALSAADLARLAEERVRLDAWLGGEAPVEPVDLTPAVAEAPEVAAP
jgi:murein DD-endopeptidase MepM/ murein hydrolase activator NlpD